TLLRFARTVNARLFSEVDVHRHAVRGQAEAREDGRTEGDGQRVNAAVAEDEQADTGVPAAEAGGLVDPKTRSRVPLRPVLARGRVRVVHVRVADERVGGRRHCRAIHADEAAEIVAVAAVVDAAVLVLALEGQRPDVFLADEQRLTGAVGDASHAGLARERQ